MPGLRADLPYDDNTFDLNRFWREAASVERLNDVTGAIWPYPVEDIVRLTLPDGRVCEVAGRDVSYDACGGLSGGWVTRLSFLQPHPPGSPQPFLEVWNITGIGLDAAPVWRALLSGAGNDLLDGGFGADTAIGGTGNDFFIVDDPGDFALESTGTLRYDSDGSGAGAAVVFARVDPFTAVAAADLFVV
jgi:hypothetical protein